MAKDTELSAKLKSTHEVLGGKGFTPKLPLVTRKTLSTSEEGKSYMLDIEGSKLSVLYQVDEYIVKDGEKCDRLVLVHTGDVGDCEQWTEIFVELKGTDVKKALNQLIETAKKPIFEHKSNIERRARVVATNFPANNSNPSIERLKIQLIKMNVKYKQFKNGQRDSI